MEMSTRRRGQRVFQLSGFRDDSPLSSPESSRHNSRSASPSEYDGTTPSANYRSRSPALQRYISSGDLYPFSGPLLNSTDDEHEPEDDQEQPITSPILWGLSILFVFSLMLFVGTAVFLVIGEARGWF